MRTWITILLATLLTATAASAEESAVGRWTTIDDETGEPKSVVAIWEEDGKLYGKIEKLFRGPDEDPDPRCVECDGELKDQPIVGMTILRDLEKDGDEWSDGTVLDPANGKTYSCTIAVEEGGKKLEVRGYLGISLLGRSQYWQRAAAPAPKAPEPEVKEAAARRQDGVAEPQRAE